jgi:hypothetical protein
MQMNNIIEGWVIQKNSGSFYKCCSFSGKHIFVKSIRQGFIYPSKSLAQEEIYCSDLKDCKIIKIEIKVVADE